MVNDTPPEPAATADKIRTSCLRPAGLRGAYVNKGFSRRQFAREVGVTEQNIRRLEAGQLITPAKAKIVADYFGVRVTDLMDLNAIAEAAQ